MTVIYRTGRTRLVLLRAVMVLSLISGAALLYGGWEALNRYGVHPSEGGELAPLPVRIALGGGMLAAGVLIICGIVLYMHACYVTKIEQADEGGDVTITLWGALVPVSFTVPAADVTLGGYEDGTPGPGVTTGSAPWYKVRINGRRMPLIVDVRGEFAQPERFDALLSLRDSPSETRLTRDTGPRRIRRPQG
ncbi:hypothetical protein [Longimicrobium terrae]|uniref:Uncharacterized protein n=1 Tax=Longimicrobium terrae TaxID=1639882 RepID=A0A841GYE5_9BACT|nr:hypothetical protein [Longimicrobium terrae]MBB4636343.1 hypothetical protein [Longimicrobium terrae]MBB6070739.1 hypothetical protein [Longimicrobium terrae]NNC29718.1 hypothetical protein [Longimicrobium terrae]